MVYGVKEGKKRQFGQEQLLDSDLGDKLNFPQRNDDLCYEDEEEIDGSLIHYDPDLEDDDSGKRSSHSSDGERVSSI